MKSRAEQVGFSLVEVVLALGIVAISILSIFGLLATGGRANHTAVEQTAAGDILTQITGDFRATPRTSSITPVFAINIGSPATVYFDSERRPSRTSNSNSRYRIDISFPASGGGRGATFVYLRAIWPAAADPSLRTTDSAEMFVALDRN